MHGRCFIAINIPDSKKERLIPLLKELKEAEVRTVIPKNIHFTLKFLGEIDQMQYKKQSKDFQK